MRNEPPNNPLSVQVTVLPADPGYYVLTRCDEKLIEKYPVIGWRVCTEVFASVRFMEVHPVTVGPEYDFIECHKAVLRPDGKVIWPNEDMTLGSVGDWDTFCDGHNPDGTPIAKTGWQVVR